MAIIEAWWAYTAIPSVSRYIIATNGPAGVTLKGAFEDKPQTVVEARFGVSHERLGLGPGVRCISPAVAVFDGEVSGYTHETLMLDGDPHLNLQIVLRQRVMVGGQVIADETQKTMLFDIKGDQKRAHITLAPLAFPPVAFHTPAEGDVEVVLNVTFDPLVHKVPLLFFQVDIRLQLPQWGIITEV